jgi:ribonuclease H / adenosylcobalamin/alpha-ribazole phosphatase
MISLLMAATLASSPPDALSGLGAVPKDSVRVLLVRHGQAYSNLDPKPKLAPAQLDRLTALGQAQVKRTAEALRGRGVTAILTSPAGRARETSEILRTTLGAPAASVEPRVRPFELGRSPGGKPLGWDEREAEWNAGRDPVPEGGESLRQLADRVLDLVASFNRTRPGQTVVVVTHGEVIAALVGALKGQPTREWEELSIQNASVTVVDAATGKPPRLVLVNVSPDEAKP